MKVWKKKIADKLRDASDGKRDKEHTIWKHATKLVEDDTGDTNELEAILAKMLLDAYDLGKP